MALQENVTQDFETGPRCDLKNWLSARSPVSLAVTQSDSGSSGLSILDLGMNETVRNRKGARLLRIRQEGTVATTFFKNPVR